MQREEILKYLKSVDTHPTAEKIYKAIQAKIPNISLGTIYRNLKQLQQSGDIITIESSRDKINYDGSTNVHQHFICLSCGNIIDLDINSHYEECEKLGHKVVRESIVLYGLCKDCNKIENL